MNLIFQTPLENGAYLPVQRGWTGEVPENWLEFPEELLPVFYPADKQAAGFVALTREGQAVAGCTWNEGAYQAWLSALPEPVNEPPLE